MIVRLGKVAPMLRKGAVDWLEKAVESRRFRTDNDKVVIMLNIMGFMNWVGRAFE